MPRFIDRTNQRNGRLIFRRFVGKNKFKQSLWEAKCDCGNIVVVQAKTQSCGCLMHEMASKANQHPKSEATKKKLSDAKKIKDTEHTCPGCQIDFIGTKQQKFCNRKCRRKFLYDAGLEGIGHRGKARKHGGKIETVVFWNVYDRDGGVCQECKKICPRELRGNRSAALAPTLGHIIPTSKGGDHAYSNVQLECLSCNSGKNNKLPEGVVAPKINPDPRTREQKISEETRKAMQRPEVRANIIAGNKKRVQTKSKKVRSKEMKSWYNNPDNKAAWLAARWPNKVS
jgi:hypothetical protein